MTHKERMAALVEAGERLSARENLEREDDNETTRGRRILASLNFQKQAAGARPTIALAAEGMRLLALYRAATKQRAEDEREHCAAGLTYSIEDLVAIEARLDALLQRWEESNE